MTHWIENIANELSKMDVEEHIIASGTSISGSIHIGNSCDIFIANGIGKKLREKGKKAKTIWIADDHDHSEKYHILYLNLTTNTWACHTQ